MEEQVGTDDDKPTPGETQLDGNADGMTIYAESALPEHDAGPYTLLEAADTDNSADSTQRCPHNYVGPGQQQQMLDNIDDQIGIGHGNISSYSQPECNQEPGAVDMYNTSSGLDGVQKQQLSGGTAIYNDPEHEICEEVSPPEECHRSEEFTSVILQNSPGGEAALNQSMMPQECAQCETSASTLERYQSQNIIYIYIYIYMH